MWPVVSNYPTMPSPPRACPAQKRLGQSGRRLAARYKKSVLTPGREDTSFLTSTNPFMTLSTRSGSPNLNFPEKIQPALSSCRCQEHKACWLCFQMKSATGPKSHWLHWMLWTGTTNESDSSKLENTFTYGSPVWFLTRWKWAIASTLHACVSIFPGQA